MPRSWGACHQGNFQANVKNRWHLTVPKTLIKSATEANLCFYITFYSWRWKWVKISILNKRSGLGLPRAAKQSSLVARAKTVPPSCFFKCSTLCFSCPGNVKGLSISTGEVLPIFWNFSAQTKAESPEGPNKYCGAVHAVADTAQDEGTNSARSSKTKLCFGNEGGEDRHCFQWRGFDSGISFSRLSAWCQIYPEQCEI